MTQTSKALKGEPQRKRTPRLTDVRSRRSQKALRGALLKLIEQKNFGKITMRDIAATAGVSYPTVFKHYAGKDELFKEIAREEVTSFLEYSFQDGGPDWRPGERICTYVGERRGLWRTLLTAGAAEAMRSEFIARGRERGASRPELGHGVPLDLVSAILASGLFETMAWWLVQDGDVSSAFIADVLETLLIEPALNLPRGALTARGKGGIRSPV